MRRIVIDGPGGYDRLQLRTLPAAALPPGHVRVAVTAAGVNYADCIVRMGLYASAKKYVGWPITPGFEVAGRVAEVGDGVDDLREGDSVVAVTRFFGYADELVVPHHQVFARPAGFTDVQAAALPAVSLTAWYALVQLARPPAGTAILVHSAAGGVGQALVQIGVHLGLRVVAVVGAAHKVGVPRDLGAAAVIDASREDVFAAAHAHAPEGYAAVFDANGRSTLRGSYRALAPAGRLVVYGFASMLPRAGQRVSWVRLAWHWLLTPRFSPLALTGDNRSVMGFNLSYLFDRTDLLEQAMACILPWAESGVLRPPPITTFPLAEAAAAHRALESGRTVGKLVLVP
jgi:NADPH:quinone reductase-like Zn-dependent oxidoreductase